MFQGRFKVSDVAQQVVGGFLLAAPFVVTEEVWVLAKAMNVLQASITVFMVFAIGYGTLYRADPDREAEHEGTVLGVPMRFVSLILVSYLSVAILAYAFDAPDTFSDGAWTTLKAVSIGAVFSVVGAATADSVF